MQDETAITLKFFIPKKNTAKKKKIIAALKALIAELGLMSVEISK